jgi:glycosyltransferase involved in cell wall biosynthesis
METVSVITCTHNPRPDYLAQSLASLRAQTLPLSRWELLVVDNAGAQPVCDRFRLDWHPQGRHLSEPAVGKTNALLKGIRQSQGELIVLVDDDNVLAPDYLERGQELASQWPSLGSWGGSIVGRYEEQPPPWLRFYECYLSVREVARDQWFNLTRPELYGNLPYGAGMCVRRAVAEQYCRLIEADDVRRRLDRRADSLVSAGDTDLALVGCDMGLGAGLFSALKLTHLIHKGRLTEGYMERMLREMTYSLEILAAKRGHPVANRSWLGRLWGTAAALRRGRREFRFHRATLIGASAAHAEVASWGTAVS